MPGPSINLPRRRDLDNVRALIVFSLVFFHTARIFDDLSFYVKNEPPVPAVSFLVILAVFCGMPMMFSIAGFAIWNSLQKRSVSAFVLERLRRLLIPFIAGLLIIVPPQIYYRLKAGPDYHESYLAFYPRFFDITFNVDLPWFISATPETGLFHPAHLWFLYNLLFYTLLLLPVFLYLRGSQGQDLIRRVVGFTARPLAVFLLAVPIALIEAALGSDMSGGWNHLVYVVFIVYGFLYAADQRFGDVLRKNRNTGLLLAIVGSLGGLFGLHIHVGATNVNPLVAYDTASVLLRFLKGFVGWCWVIAILGYLEHLRHLSGAVRESDGSNRFKSFRYSVERYANEAVLPFYIIHQTVIVVIGFYVVRWPVGALVKFMIISLATLMSTLLLYEVVIKRTRLTRILFGMKAQLRQQESQGGNANTDHHHD